MAGYYAILPAMYMTYFWQVLNQLSFDLPAFILVITIHEYLHVITARHLLGSEHDQPRFRAKQHLDLFGTLLPICLVFSGYPIIFGWGKRTEAKFDENVHQIALKTVFATSGIAGNLLICLLTGLVISSIPSSETLFSLTSTSIGVFMITLLFRIFAISLAMLLVNLLPIPPFDGGYLLFSLLPARFARWQEKLQILGLLIVVSLVLTGIASAIFFTPYQLLTEIFCGGLSPYVLNPGTFAGDFLNR